MINVGIETLKDILQVRILSDEAYKENANNRINVDAGKHDEYKGISTVSFG